MQKPRILIRRLLFSAPTSVARDDRTAKSVVDADRAHVDILLDGVGTPDSGERRRERHAAAAHEQMVVFESDRKVRRKAEYDAGADSAAPAGFARRIEDH